MIYRQNTSLQEHDQSPTHRNVLFYELINKPGRALPQAERRRDLEANEQTSYFNVQVIADTDLDNDIIFTVYCNGDEFTELEYGGELFEAVAEKILQKRRGNKRYPCYITDIDLSRLSWYDHDTDTQTCTYLHYKAQLEQQLNDALEHLLDNPN